MFSLQIKSSKIENLKIESRLWSFKKSENKICSFLFWIEKFFSTGLYIPIISPQRGILGCLGDSSRQNFLLSLSFANLNKLLIKSKRKRNLSFKYI